MLDGYRAACYPSPVATRPPYEAISEREIATGRALAAVAYLPGLFLIGLLDAPRNRFVRFHARQGLVLFLAEAAALVAIAIVDGSLGRIPVLGVVVGAVLRLALGLLFLAVALYGIAKALSGETVRIPYLGDVADRMEV
ncbi:MAG TPA: hypothetical protein VFM00_09865 [Candidatus Eisenbacteria bacterium]|nr:hypothetical protein [Candidatus Eisenbacteria bacterium]